MKDQKGTTPSWKRPFNVALSFPTFMVGGFFDINVLDVLVMTRMAQSKAEAKRLIEQGILWLDNGTGEFIWDRLQKIVPQNDKFLIVERGNMLCIGKRLDDALCHRIEFV